MKRIGIYVRVSTMEQAESGYSVDEQIDKLKKYCEIKDWSIIKIYKDPGFSGANIERPALSNLITDVKMNKIDSVLVYKLDRLSRSQKDTLYLIEDVFNKNNVSFVSLSENFDTATAFGKAMIGILAVFAQLEREQIRERMMMGKLGRAKSGKAMSWNHIPFGYKYEDGEYIIDPLRAEIVKKIFSDYASGLTATKIRTALNDEGYIGRSLPWSHPSLRWILKNPIYAGKIRFNDVVYDGTHQAIITEDLFNQVQNQILIRQQQTAEKNHNPRPFQSKFMLSGLLRCGICGARYKIVVGKKRLDGTVSRKYKCVSRFQKSTARDYVRNPKGCESSTLLKEDLEKEILSIIEGLRIDTTEIEKLSDSKRKYDDKPLRARLLELNVALEKVADLYIDGNIPKEMLEKRKTEIINEKDSIEIKIADMDSNIPELSLDNTLSKLEKIQSSVFDLSYEDQTRLVRELIKEIVIQPDGLDIHWRFVV